MSLECGRMTRTAYREEVKDDSVTEGGRKRRSRQHEWD